MNQATSEDYIRDERIDTTLTPNFTSELPEFVTYKKIPRYRRDIVITEKIDGTNAVIHISEDGVMTAGSRSRWIAPGKSTDNHGFAGWVEEHYEELLVLGPGYTFGEWYGSGINRAYGLKNGEKRFALFVDPVDRKGELPKCCEITPRLYTGIRSEAVIEIALRTLADQGSFAAPGFMRPEGIVIFDTASRGLHKITLEHDEIPKELVKNG